jgi:hypothetical protein
MLNIQINENLIFQLFNFGNKLNIFQLRYINQLRNCGFCIGLFYFAKFTGNMVLRKIENVLILVLIPTSIFCQEFPFGWIGTYEGKMKISSGKGTIELPVSLDIREKEKDSIWSYKMIYTSPNGEVVKDYKIVKKSEYEYIMDEGEIKIGMKYLDNTFFDYYQLDSMYFTSTLRKIDSKTLMFDIYGGSLKEKDKKTTSEDSFFVNSYVPAFVQSVKFKRKKK